MYQWHQYRFKLTDCLSLELGQKHHLIGRVALLSDKFVFNTKELAIQSIKQLPPTSNSVNAGFDQLATFLLKTKTSFLESILGSLESPDQILMGAILTGNKQRLSTEQRHLIEVTGMQHAFAVSGQHLSIVLTAFKPIFRRFWPSNIALPLVILAWLLAWVVGLSASMVRAALMASISLLVGRFWHRPINSARLLTIVIAVMLLVNPWWLVDIGFQLTLAAMIGVIASQNILSTKKDSFTNGEFWTGNFSLTEDDHTPSLTLRAKIVGYIRETTLVTTVITLVVAPLTVWYFQSLSLLAVAANVLVLWLFPLILASAFAVALCFRLIVIVHFLEPLISSLMWVFELPIAAAMKILAWLSQFDRFFIEVEITDIRLILIYYCVLTITWVFLVRKPIKTYQLSY